MTEQLFFDTDCISSFLWVKQENLILQLYPGRIILPQDVFNELNQPYLPHFMKKLSELKRSGEISTMSIMINTGEFDIFHELTIAPQEGRKIIGRGEAAAIALAKVNNGIIASNNFKDISQYISLYKLKHVSTCDILVEAFNKKLIDESTGNRIWISMLQKKRLLPFTTFSDYLKHYNY